jgi:phage protein D
MDALTPDQVPQARFVLNYQHRNITHDISQYLLSLSYSDFLSGQADSLDIELDDADSQWLDAWYPGHGDSLTLSLGWAGQSLRTLGSFEIDEIELNCPPSTVSIRALSAGIKGALRTTEHHAYEDMTLDAVARLIAARQGLVLIGSIEPIKLSRLTQQDSDLTFLRNLADEYDYAFKVTGNRMVFHAISALANAAPVARLTLNELANVRLRDTLAPKAVQVKHKDPNKKKLVAYRIENGQTLAVPSSLSQTTTSGDTKKQRKKAVSEATAKAKAKAEMAKANRERTTGGWTTEGKPNLVSGNVISLSAAGMLGGNYLITSAHHRITRGGGYIVDKTVCRVSSAMTSVIPDLALSAYGLANEVVA